MIFHAFARILRTRAAAENERPVARLSEEQLSRSLLQCSFRKAACLGIFARQSGHPLLRDMQVRINPLVGFIQPHPPISLFAPARGAGNRNLVRRMPFQVFGWSDEL